jgi:hypothetical protein
MSTRFTAHPLPFSMCGARAKYDRWIALAGPRSFQIKTKNGLKRWKRKSADKYQLSNRMIADAPRTLTIVAARRASAVAHRDASHRRGLI